MSEEMPYVMKKSLSEQFKIPITTLRGILKNKDAIKIADKEWGFHSMKRRKIHSGKFYQLEKAFMQWLSARASNIAVNYQFLK